MESLPGGKEMQRYEKKATDFSSLENAFYVFYSHFNRRVKPRGGMRGGRTGLDDNAGPGMNRDMSSGGRGGFAVGRGGYHTGNYRGAHGHPQGLGGRPGELPGQGEHMVHHGGPPVAFKPAPEFEMKGNDFPALPGLDEPPKVSGESNENPSSSKPWDSKG